jgi:hypothetical protein
MDTGHARGLVGVVLILERDQQFHYEKRSQQAIAR